MGNSSRKTPTAADILMSGQYKSFVVKRRTRRGKKLNEWYLQCYVEPAHQPWGLWRTGSAQGGFKTREEAYTWAQTLIRMKGIP